MGSSAGDVKHEIDTRPYVAIVIEGNKAVLRVFHVWGNMPIAWRDIDGPVEIVPGKSGDFKGEKGWGSWRGKSYPVIDRNEVTPQA